MRGNENKGGGSRGQQSSSLGERRSLITAANRARRKKFKQWAESSRKISDLILLFPECPLARRSQLRLFSTTTSAPASPLPPRSHPLLFLRARWRMPRTLCIYRVASSFFCRRAARKRHRRRTRTDFSLCSLCCRNYDPYEQPV